MKRQNNSEQESIKKRILDSENEDEMGEFEDDEDEVESEDGDDYEQENEEMDNELQEKLQDLKVYLPGQELEKDQVLVVDQSTYDMLHFMNVEWPCLSFDIVKDKLGVNRSNVFVL